MAKMAVLIKQQKPAKNSGERYTATKFISATNRKIEASKLLIKEIQAIVQNNRGVNPKKNKKSEQIRSQSKPALGEAGKNTGGIIKGPNTRGVTTVVTKNTKRLQMCLALQPAYWII
jgi:hypothetical protein